MAVQQVQNLPAPFIEAAGQTYLADLQSAIGDLKGKPLSAVLGPQFVAGPSALTQQAQSLAGVLELLHRSYRQRQLVQVHKLINNFYLHFNKT